MRWARERQGSVLALAVLVLVALQLLAHGALVMAQAEASSSRTGVLLLQARAAAEAGASDILEGPTDAWDSLAPAEYAPPHMGSLGPHPYLGRVKRLAREYWLAEGRGRSRGEIWEVTVRRLVWRLDPVGRIAAALGGAEVGGALPPPSVTSFDVEVPAFCYPWRTVLDSVASVNVWGAAALRPRSTTPEPALGLLGGADLAERLPGLDVGVVTPAPASSLGRCDPDAPWNWGDPVHPGGACGDLLVGRYVTGDLRLVGGVGQGILAVSGDLDVVDTRFDGILLVGGTLTLEGGAEVRGFVGVGGELHAAQGARILGSPCRAIRALDRFRAFLGEPIPVREVGLLEDPQ